MAIEAQPFIYLATAYTSKLKLPLIGKFMMWLRFKRVSKIVVGIMKQGYTVFSPITHSHVAWAECSDRGTIQTDHEFWMKQDRWYVELCDAMVIFDQPGWDKSTGVLREIKWCVELDIPICMINSKGELYPYVEPK